MEIALFEIGLLQKHIFISQKCAFEGTSNQQQINRVISS